MLENLLFLKKIRILYFLPLLIIFALCSLPLPAAYAATVTIAWDKNLEDDVIGYKFHYGTISKNYQYTVDVNNNTSCSISGLAEGTTYYFAATAYNDKNIESSYSEELTHTIPDTPPPPPLQYDLTVDTVGDGSVELDPPGATYNEGTVVKLTAVDGPGSAFDSWSGDITRSANPISITMEADKIVTANFVAVPQFTLTANTIGDGSVELDPPGGTYNEGTVVQLMAVAGPGSAFDSWSRDITSSANPVNITMDADKNVTATFTESAYIYSETFDAYTAGADPADWLDTAANNSMAENDTLFEVFDLNGDKVFGTTSTQTNIHSHHTGPGIDTLSAYEYSGRMMMTASNSDIGVTFFSQYPNTDAYYRLRQYGNSAFHIAPHPHGTKIDGDTDTGVYSSPNVWYWFRILVEDTGTRTEIRAKVWPENSAEPTAWQVDCYDTSASRLTAGTIGVWSMGSGNKYWDDLTVTPLGPPPLQYALTVDSVGDGSVELDPTGGTYNEGTVVQLTAVAGPGSAFDSWSGDITGFAKSVTITMDADMYVAATFTEIVVEIPKYSLTVDADGSGSVILDPAGGVYEQGTQVMLTASAEPGWEFNGWSGDLSDSANPATIVMTGDRNITVTFSAITQHILDLTTVGNGWVSVDPDQAEYDLGQLVTMRATADPGWVFTGWSDDLSGISNPTTLMITGDHQVTATFVDSTQAYAEDFEAYTDGADPVDWLDTAAKNSMAENDSLFEVFDLNGDKVYGTTSTQTNIHSHQTDPGIDALSAYEYSGRMMMTAPRGGIGVTFFSQYPNTDAYYRLRRYRNSAFHIAPHPHGTKIDGDTDTGVYSSPNVWYWFRILVEDTGTRTEIRAKVWPESSAEPAAWQVDCYDSKSSRLTSGAIGVWSSSRGRKYWDDMAVNFLSP